MVATQKGDKTVAFCNHAPCWQSPPAPNTNVAIRNVVSCFAVAPQPDLPCTRHPVAEKEKEEHRQHENARAHARAKEQSTVRCRPVCIRRRKSFSFVFLSRRCNAGPLRLQGGTTAHAMHTSIRVQVSTSIHICYTYTCTYIYICVSLHKGGATTLYITVGPRRTLRAPWEMSSQQQLHMHVSARARSNMLTWRLPSNRSRAARARARQP